MARMNAMSNDRMMEWKIIDETNPNDIKKNMDIDWKFKKRWFYKGGNLRGTPTIFVQTIDG